MSVCWDEHGLYIDDTPFSGCAAHYAKLPHNFLLKGNNEYYRVFFRHFDNTYSSYKHMCKDEINAFIKNILNEDSTIIGYCLYIFCRHKKFKCREYGDWDSEIDINTLEYTEINRK